MEEKARALYGAIPLTLLKCKSLHDLLDHL